MKTIQRITLVKNPNTQAAIPPGDFFAYVWNSKAESEYIASRLSDFA